MLVPGIERDAGVDRIGIVPYDGCEIDGRLVYWPHAVEGGIGSFEDTVGINPSGTEKGIVKNRLWKKELLLLLGNDPHSPVFNRIEQVITGRILQRVVLTA